MSKPSFVYVTYIRSTAEQVWQALTDPNITEKYWYGYRVAANGKAGEHMTAIDPGGKEVHHDVILVSDPPRRLSYAWCPLYDEFKRERPSSTSRPSRTRCVSLSSTTTSTKVARYWKKSKAAGRRCCRA